MKVAERAGDPSESDVALSVDAERQARASRWTERFDARWGAGALLACSLTYLAVTTARGYSAVSVPPVEVAATEASVGVWEAAAALLERGPGTLVLDTRSPDLFAAFHLPGSVNLPSAGFEQLASRARGHAVVILVSDSDERAAKLVAQARSAGPPGTAWHYLGQGVRDWYLTFELPVAVFTDKSPPFGYEASLRRVRDALKAGRSRAELLPALARMRALEYSPTLLRGKKVAATSGKKRKKITGGCGG